jgi:hypothetical protein
MGSAPLARAEEIEEKDAPVRSMDNKNQVLFLLPKVLCGIFVPLSA